MGEMNIGQQNIYTGPGIVPGTYAWQTGMVIVRPRRHLVRLK